jgi:hypothetical protein
MPTNRDIVFKALGLKKTDSPSLEELADLTDLPIEALRQVERRGQGAWGSNISSVRLKKDFSHNPDLKKFPRSARLTKEQWGRARVYAFIAKGRTFHTADADIAREFRIG